MIRNQYNRIPHPAQDTKRERNINTLNEPRHEKPCLRGFRPGKTQIGLLNYRD